MCAGQSISIKSFCISRFNKLYTFSVPALRILPKFVLQLSAEKAMHLSIKFHFFKVFINKSQIVYAFSLGKVSKLINFEQIPSLMVKYCIKIGINFSEAWLLASIDIDIEGILDSDIDSVTLLIGSNREQ